MRSTLFCGAAIAALVLPAAALAQSTGTIDSENQTDIVITGSRAAPDVNGIQSPDQPKARAVLTQELIERRAPGTTILDTINLVPGVSFTNGDPYGGATGNLRIRGFSGDRVSLTFDGIPLNDSGNYAVYSNQQLDPELIDQVNVNFGATDVDSPTAGASGGTVNYRSIIPTDDLHATVVGSYGSYDQTRVFGLLQTGTFTSFGTKAWLSASSQKYDQYRGFGGADKQQYNGKIYQPLGGKSFISIAGHYNQNRVSFYSNPNLTNLRTRLATNGTVIPANAAITPANPYTLALNDDQFDYVYDDTSSAYLYDNSCTLPSAAAPTAGTVQDDRTACGNVRTTPINPSNTGNVRINSLFELADKLTFTFDGAFSYTLANGGGSQVFAESDANATQSSVYNRQLQRLGAGIAPGKDLNGDGDLLDYVRVYFPSNTRTHRLTGIASLRYDLDPNNTLRVAYTYDRARHRQTGEAGLLDRNGSPLNVFGGITADDGAAVTDAAGEVLQKRNRLSYAILNQISGEYRGQFFDDSFTLQAGVRAPFFKRNLTNYCYTIPGSSNDAYCTSQTPAQVAANATTATYGAPYRNRIKKYDAVLPNVGFVYHVTPAASVFGSYAKGISVPKTENLYGFDDVKVVPVAAVQPEKTDSFDLGLRYSSRIIQAQVAGWYINYKNRIISSTVILEGGGSINLDRNVGTVHARGVDASLGIQPVKPLSLYGYVSYNKSILQNDTIDPGTGAVLAATRGKFVVETPEWTYGGRAQLDIDPFSVGVQVKRTGDRWVTDINDLKTSGFTVVDLDARVGLGGTTFGRTYFQLNVSNLFDEGYFGNLSTTTNAAGGPRFTFGSPRAVIGSIHFEF